MSQFAAKDPGDTIDVRHQWEFPPAMAAVTITASTWASDRLGLTIGPSTIAGRTTIARVSGGTAGTVYRLTNHITCSDGQVFERSTLLPVKDL
jgi:hypothetical protein